MPYNAETGGGVPSHVRGAKARRQWASIWNSVYQETGSEERAFAEANSVYNRRKKKKISESDLVKFGTKLTGFTEGIYGPFQCGTCKFSKALGDEQICVNMNVADDAAVPEDEFSNKVIDSEDCCNYWEATTEKELEVKAYFDEE